MISECPSCRYPIGDLQPGPTDLTVGESDRTEEETLVRCPNCGASLESIDPDALSVTAESPANSRSFAHFRLRKILGRGGFGTVWLADDLRLDRRVAVKLPRRTPGNLGNLVREAKTVAKLRHPNIVSVHEVGEEHGQAFIVCEYIEGMDLRSLLRKGMIPEKRVIELLQAIAAGLNHAHENQVVHRDMKPGNVLVDESGTPLVTDFGLAKNIDVEESISSKGKIVGTVVYMAPEQAGSELEQVDRRADIYAMGVMMFEMLTGERPFRGDLPAIMHQKASDEPPPSLRELRPSIARDLETICRKCLQRSPARRYETATEVAEELERYRRGLPILARPVSNFEYAWRWCLRNRAVAGLLTLLFLSLSIGLAGTTYFWITAREQTEQVQRSLYASQMMLASGYYTSGDTEAMRRSLDRFRTPELQHFRGFEWHFLDRNLQRFGASIQQDKRIDDVAISREGDWFATVAADRILRLWDARSGALIREIPSKIGRWQCVAISHRDNQLVAGAKDGTVYSWASIQDETVQPRVIKHGPGVTHVKFSPDGRRLFTSGVRGAVRVWDASTFERVEEIPTGQEGLVDFDVSKDGSVIVTVGAGGMLRAWDVETRTRLCEVYAGRPVKSVAQSPDGARWVAATFGGGLLSYNIDGSELFVEETTYGWISDIGFLGASSIVAVCTSDGSIVFYDCDTRREVRSIETHNTADGMFSVSAKARNMVVGSVRGAVKVIDIRDFAKSDVMTSDQVVRDVRMLSGEEVLVAYGDGSVDRVDFATQSVQMLSEPSGRKYRAIAASQRASWMAIADRDGSVQLLDAVGEQFALIRGNGSEAVALRFSASGEQLAVADVYGTLTLFAIGSGSGPIVDELFSLKADGEAGIEDLCLSRDGSQIAVAMDREEVRFVDVVTKSWAKARIKVSSPPVSVAFAGKDLLVGTRDGFLRRFDGSSLQLVWGIKAQLSQLNKISVIPGGGAVATVGGDTVLKIWDLVNGDLRFTIYRHQNQIFGLDSSIDGKTLVTGGLRGDVRIWRANGDR